MHGSGAKARGEAPRDAPKTSRDFETLPRPFRDPSGTPHCPRALPASPSLAAALAAALTAALAAAFAHRRRPRPEQARAEYGRLATAQREFAAEAEKKAEEARLVEAEKAERRRREAQQREARCSRDVAEMQPRCSRGVAGV